MVKNKSLKQLQKHLNLDLRNLSKWLKENKIHLNASKTELLIVRHPKKPINYDLKIKIDGKKLILSKYVKYLVIVINSHLNWEFQSEILQTKLSRAIGMLSEIRHGVPKDTLRSIYYGIFSSLLTDGSQIWDQIQNKHVKRLTQQQNKEIRIINFASYLSAVDPLYKTLKILKLCDNIKLQNFLYDTNSINGNLPSTLKNTFTLTNNAHKHNTRGSVQHQIVTPKVKN